MDILRDPLWNNIRLDPLALALLDTPVLQRLRYVRQLGHTFLVYPGATHSRFEHALGAWHLAGIALRLLDEAGSLRAVSQNDQLIIRAAALLHDVGHYPFSHALEEIGATHHEVVARSLIMDGPVGEILGQRLGPGSAREIVSLVAGESRAPLQGLISGSIDLDKIEYLKRDALMCGVPYGEIDVDRLLNSLVLVQPSDQEHLAIGVHEKGLSALESLLFAKYQMYRNVYWHHAVRSATAMYKRLVATAIEAGVLSTESVAGFTDEGLLTRLESSEIPFEGRQMLESLRVRHIYKRAYECPAASLGEGVGEWIASDYRLTRQVENLLAMELKLPPGSILIDYPAKTQMLGVDIPMLRRDGRVERLTAAGFEGALNLPRLSDELYQSARRLRVFSRDRSEVPQDLLLSLLTQEAGSLKRLVGASDPESTS